MDRPLGSRHPDWDFHYPVNYGYVPGVLASDGEELDAYVQQQIDKAIAAHNAHASQCHPPTIRR